MMDDRLNRELYTYEQYWNVIKVFSWEWKDGVRVLYRDYMNGLFRIVEFLSDDHRRIVETDDHYLLADTIPPEYHNQLYKSLYLLLKEGLK